jgi:hypothetical protein
MERATPKLNPIRLAAREKCHCVLAHESNVPQIEGHRLARRLDAKKLLQLLDILHLHSAAESEHHLPICCSLDSEHKRSCTLSRAVWRCNLTSALKVLDAKG